MRRSLSIVVAAIPLFLLTSCTQKVGSGDAPPPATATEPPPSLVAGPMQESRAKGVVIATLVTHDSKVSILSRASGELRVVVRKTDGQIVADGVTIDELRKTDPMLHAIVTSAVASNDGSGNYVDATYQVHHSLH